MRAKERGGQEFLSAPNSVKEVIAMKKELPIWVVAVIIIAVVVIVVAIFWRAARPLPEVKETPEMEKQMGEAMRRAFELGERPEKYGSKIVPSPYAPKKSTQGQ